jgi:hypothetical protein
MSDLPWQSASCFYLAGMIAAILAVLWISKWLDGAEVRAIKRRRKQIRCARITLRELNRERPGAFCSRELKDWRSHD